MHKIRQIWKETGDGKENKSISLLVEFLLDLEISISIPVHPELRKLSDVFTGA